MNLLVGFVFSQLLSGLSKKATMRMVSLSNAKATRRVAKLLFALCIAAAMPAITPMTGANAEANDDFIAALDDSGMPGDRGVEIAIAHRFCDAQNLPRFAFGVTAPWVVAMQTVSSDAATQGIAGPQLIAFKTAARDAYCPGADIG